MKVSVFGNPDLGSDNVPHKMLPDLKKAFPQIDFEVQDPNELELPSEDIRDWVILDTVQGLKNVRTISLEEISRPDYRVASHDFDLSMHLHLVRKLNKNIRIHILGVPMHGDSIKELVQVTDILHDLEKEGI